MLGALQFAPIMPLLYVQSVSVVGVEQSICLEHSHVLLDDVLFCSLMQSCIKFSIIMYSSAEQSGPEIALSNGKTPSMWIELTSCKQ